VKQPIPHIRMKANGRQAPRPKRLDPIATAERAAARADKAHVGRSATRSVVVSFRDIPRDRWEQAFGKHDPEKFRRAAREQAEARKAEAREVAERPQAAAVHGDNKGTGRRMYHGFDWGLGCQIDGKGDRRRKMDAAGLKAAL
jgi:hypothetical protein